MSDDLVRDVSERRFEQQFGALRPKTDEGLANGQPDLRPKTDEGDDVEADMPPTSGGSQSPPEGQTDDKSWQPLPINEAAEAEPRREADRFHSLIYGNGGTTLLSSEPGIGKTMLLAAIAAEEAIAERIPLALDFEGGGPAMTLERLTLAGLSDEQLARIHYVRPRFQARPEQLHALVEQLRPSLVTLDSFDAGLAAYGLETKNEDVRAFQSRVIDPLRSTGAPIVIADHVGKDRERRGRFSIGGQAKLGICDAHLGLTPIVPLRRGTGGKLKIIVHKDWHGWLPRTAVFELISHPDTGALSWNVRASDEDATGDGFRPTGFMEKISRALEVAGQSLSRAELERSVGGKRDYVRQAIDTLIRDGYADEVQGPRGARLVELNRPYREDDE
jgi:hypothetical protein